MRNLINLKVIYSVVLVLVVVLLVLHGLQLVLLSRVNTGLGIVSTKAQKLGEELDKETGELSQGWEGMREDWAKIEDHFQQVRLLVVEVQTRVKVLQEHLALLEPAR